MPFEPKQKVELDPPKDDVISKDYLSKCDGQLLLQTSLKCMLTGFVQDHTKGFRPTLQLK